MGRYRGRDVLRVPGLLSLSRVPLAAAFPLAVHRPLAAFCILALAGLTDVLDGWYARRFDQVTPTGSVLDPITDKLFVTVVATTLIVTGHLSVASVLLLSTRELGELPLVLWLALDRQARRTRAEHPTANVMGKAATTLQFVAVTAALFGETNAGLWVGATAVVGALAAFTYWRRALRTHRRAKSRPGSEVDPECVDSHIPGR